MQSDELFIRSKKRVPGGVHSPVRSLKGLNRSPVFFESAKGAYLKSVEGKSYLDFCQSFGPLLLGHRDDEVQAAVEEIIGKVWTLGACERYSLELAEWICDQISFIEKVRFVNSGTEAVMTALRLARGVTGRKKVLKFEGCYHGHVDSMLVKAGSGLAGTTASDSSGVTSTEDTLIAPLNSESHVTEIFDQFGKDIAAVIIEPLPANFGLMPQRKEFLQFLRKICKDNSSLLIFDEVISGFRCGLSGISGAMDISPDIVTYGKIIGGGFPVGAFAANADIMDHLAPVGSVYQAGTLSANPVGMVAGLATLKKAKRENVWETINQRTARLADASQRILEKREMNMASHYSLFWINVNKEPARAVGEISENQGQFFPELFDRLLESGIYLSPNAYEVGFLSAAHSDEDVEMFLTQLEKSI